MYKKFVISFSIFFLSAYSVFSQSAQIKGVVINNDTEEPVPTAFIFINNTSYGTETNDAGKYILECRVDVSGDLIISHINYESITISFAQIDEIPDTIRLVPEAVLLDEVLVSENKGKNRKKWLKKFKKSFLGDDNSDKMKILNPNDILFSESKDSFYAIASQPLVIVNHRLG